MGYCINGTNYLGIEEGAISKSTKPQEAKYETEIKDFFATDFLRLCKKHCLRRTPGTVLNLALRLHGVYETLNGEGNAKYCVKTSLDRVTRFERIYFAENYLVEYDAENDNYEAKLLLANEQWLRACRVENAFQKICVARKWDLDTLSRPKLVVLKQNGFEVLAWLSEVEDEIAKHRKMACFITNGLIVPDIDVSDVKPYVCDSSVISCRDCRFRAEFASEKIVALHRI